jgi:hypothetical protein
MAGESFVLFFIFLDCFSVVYLQFQSTVFIY